MSAHTYMLCTWSRDPARYWTIDMTLASFRMRKNYS